MLQNNQALAGQDDLYASASFDKATNEIILKIANTSINAQTRDIQLDGVKKIEAKAKWTILKNDNLGAVNTFENATNVSPIEQSLDVNT